MLCYTNNGVQCYNTNNYKSTGSWTMQVAGLWAHSLEKSFEKVKTDFVLSRETSIFQRGVMKYYVASFTIGNQELWKSKVWFQKTSHLGQWVTFCSYNGEGSSGRDSNVIIHAVSQPTSTAGLHNAYKCEKKRIQKPTCFLFHEYWHSCAVLGGLI